MPAVLIVEYPRSGVEVRVIVRTERVSRRSRAHAEGCTAGTGMNCKVQLAGGGIVGYVNPGFGVSRNRIAASNVSMRSSTSPSVSREMSSGQNEPSRNTTR